MLRKKTNYKTGQCRDIKKITQRDSRRAKRHFEMAKNLILLRLSRCPGPQCHPTSTASSSHGGNWVLTVELRPALAGRHDMLFKWSLATAAICETARGAACPCLSRERNSVGGPVLDTGVLLCCHGGGTTCHPPGTGQREHTLSRASNNTRPRFATTKSMTRSCRI